MIRSIRLSPGLQSVGIYLVITQNRPARSVGFGCREAEWQAEMLGVPGVVYFWPAGEGLQRNMFTFCAPSSSAKRMYSPSLRVMAHAAPAQSVDEQVTASDVEARLRINVPALQHPSGHGRTR